LYNLTFIVGLAMSFGVFWVLSFFFPPPGLGEEAPFVDEVLSGMEEPGSETGKEELGMADEKHGAAATVT
jgi:NCS1 family nucleobase:cation symporter-1